MLETGKTYRKAAMTLLGILTATLAMPAIAVDQFGGDMFGVWGALIIQGNFKSLSPILDKLQWQLMNQTRTRDDSPKGSRFTENLLFGQIGYRLNDDVSLWLGYVNDWIDPLNKPFYQESRPYQDLTWNHAIGDFKLTSRTRSEQRINRMTGDTGYRARQLVQISHDLPIGGLSVYIGDEVFFYLNENGFGKRGLSENRIMSGLSYQITDHFGLDLGYSGQYIDTTTLNNLLTHNMQVNLRYKF